MALGVTEKQVTWSSSDSVSVSSSSNATSDAITNTSGTVFQAKIELKADNDGTPASGDTVDFYLLESLGDPDGASTEEYATTTHGQHLARLDTNTSDPAIAVVHVPGPFYKFKIYAVNNSSARAQTVSACLLEQTA